MAQKACKNCHLVVDEAEVNASGLCETCAAQHAAELAALELLTS